MAQKRQPKKKEKEEVKGYHFEKGRHRHSLDGKPLFGVTTVLSVISKPQLIAWSANMAVDYIIENATVNKFRGKVLDYEVTERILTDARKAHAKKRDAAGDWGTDVHKAIEKTLKEGVTPELEGFQKTVYDKFVTWAEENDADFLESEKHVWSENLWIGGILDMIVRFNGKTYIGDIKTSSGIYPEMWAQMGAYHLCLQEMGEYPEIEGYLIVNLTKEGKIKVETTDDMLFNQNFFKSALELYKNKKHADEKAKAK